MPLISAVVCTYNRCESLRDTLRSLLAQALGEGVSLEVIVVDNNSADRTRQVVESFARASHWPVRYVFESRQGKSHALNRGIQAAQGDLIAFTDDDVLVEPSWVQALAEALLTHHADCVGGKILLRWSQPPPAWLLQHGLLGGLGFLDRGPHPIVAEEPNEGFLHGANIAFRKEIFAELGGFRTDLGRIGKKRMAGEETEMLRRLFKAGKRVVYTPDAVVHHYVPPEHMRKSHMCRMRFRNFWSLMLITDPRSDRLPLWLVRECFANGVASVWAYARGRREQGLRLELVCWAQLGMLVGTANRRWKQQSPPAVNVGSQHD